MVEYRKIRLGLLCKEFLMRFNRKTQMELLLVARLRVKVTSERMMYLMAVEASEGKR